MQPQRIRASALDRVRLPSQDAPKIQAGGLQNECSPFQRPSITMVLATRRPPGDCHSGGSSPPRSSGRGNGSLSLGRSLGAVRSGRCGSAGSTSRWIGASRHRGASHAVDRPGRAVWLAVARARDSGVQAAPVGWLVKEQSAVRFSMFRARCRRNREARRVALQGKWIGRKRPSGGL
jgi:hypothetical protein